MADWRNGATISGFLALAATLALLSPGVTAVRADDGASADPPQGATCEAGPAPIDAAVLAKIEQLKQLEARARAARASRPPADDEIVVLNGRGYNYDQAPPQLPDSRELSADH